MQLGQQRHDRGARLVRWLEQRSRLIVVRWRLVVRRKLVVVRWRLVVRRKLVLVRRKLIVRR
jgi:hypothetical protein